MTVNSERYQLIGSLGSPYSRKMRALMRYRRLPFNWILRTPRLQEKIAHVKPALVPILQLPEDGSMHIDSTPLAYLLEDRHPGDRSILPDNPALAFLSHLIEDMADEWVTKAMFHYRWAYPDDADYASHWIADDGFPDSKSEDREAVAKSFGTRQISRMPLVGCTEQNAPAIEASYLHILDLLESHVGQFDFLFGTRPSLGDFGLFGQLITLATDPTPMAIMRARAQRTESWLRQLDDASGIEGDWINTVRDLPKATTGLIEMAGKIYLPFLAANAAAIKKGEETFSLDLMGHNYEQGVFKYQIKCLTDLRNRYQKLDNKAKDQLADLLESSGCLPFLS